SSGTVNSGYVSLGPLSMALATKGQQYAVSLYVRGMSGSTSWQVAFADEDASQGLLGALTTNNVTPTARWQRFTFTYTPSSAGVHKFRIYVRETSGAAGVVRVDNVMVVAGATSPAYFDGATSGAVWLDPVTGVLGTAHASPSVSQAAPWVEEGVTN